MFLFFVVFVFAFFILLFFFFSGWEFCSIFSVNTISYLKYQRHCALLKLLLFLYYERLGEGGSEKDC